MSGTSGLPQAPPVAPQAPKTSKTFWILLSVVGVFVVLGGIGMTILGLAVLSGQDPIDFIDKEEFLSSVEPACDDLKVLTDDMKAPLTPEQLGQIVAAGRAIPAALDKFSQGELDDDYPTQDWGEDWTTLMNAVEQYATSLASNKDAAYETPETEDKFSIVGRMDIGNADCEVPEVIVDLDPSPPPIPTY